MIFGLIAFLFVFIALVLWACVAVGSRHDMPEPPEPTTVRKITPRIDHYDCDLEAGTITYHVVVTQADAIRAMTDEELANFLSWLNESKTCFEWLDWLKEEVSE